VIVRGLAWYYLSRLAIVALWLVAATVGGLPPWASVLPAAAMIGYFVWVPLSGRYVVHQDRPLTPMRRDERSQAVTYRAVAWAFTVQMLLLGFGIVWATLSRQEQLGAILGFILATGMLTYLVAQGWLSRRS
jgi:hypothetical protein